MPNPKYEQPKLVLSDSANPPVWEFYLASELPPDAVCSAAGCVAIRDLTAEEVVLTIKTEANSSDISRVNKLELPSGGIEAGETAKFATKRESDEEAGFTCVSPLLFGYRKYNNDRGDNPRYANHPVSYMPYYWDYNSQTPGRPSDSDQANGSFNFHSLSILEKSGWINATELAIIRFGLDTAHQYYDKSPRPYL
jgi:ADP-ribose pyrophosphatase YjhB (NUDIX family)